MYHMRFSGTHYEAGYIRGNIFKKVGLQFNLKLDDFQLDYGIKSGNILKQYFNEAYEEVRGITDALDVDHKVFLAWMMCMGCCMYNLEDNLPEIRGCTAFCFSQNGEVYYGRNNDLPHFLKKGSQADYYKLKNTPRFYMTTSSFVNGEEGVNEFGLVVAMTFVATNLKDISPGFNSVFIVRYLLEKASSTREAIELLKNIPIASNCNILLGDKSKDLVVVECNKNVINIREPLINESKVKYVVTTNEFSSKEMRKYEEKVHNYKASLRYEVASSALEKIGLDDNPIEYSKSILKGEFGFMCQYEERKEFETIWSTIIQINDFKIIRAEGNPRKAVFKIDERLKI
ncbi:MAG: C45 family autoproteolytic acyltransferase/hydrolase [Candidatus Izemoplasmatales bacterium]|nr:C45 family autoproteolytic acyltransferase/hydrolase [Candidatus Izemoplasmatales bacterium]